MVTKLKVQEYSVVVVHMKKQLILLYIFEIGTNDIANGKLASWDSNKTIKVQVREHNSSYDVKYINHFIGMEEIWTTNNIPRIRNPSHRRRKSCLQLNESVFYY